MKSPIDKFLSSTFILFLSFIKFKISSLIISLFAPFSLKSIINMILSVNSFD